MSYDPRTIAFMAEILYPPIQLATDVLQGIHNKLFQQPEIAYQNFQVAPDGVHLTNLPESPGATSAVTFLPDRFVIREELRATTLEDFVTRMVNVTGISLQELGIEASVGQQFVVRSLVTPRHVTDSREFMTQRMLGGPVENWQKLGRPMDSLGVRFTFPQHEDQSELFNVRIETWNQDPRSIWIENVGTFTPPVPAAEVPSLSAHMSSTYRFVTGPVCDFVSSFDTP